MVQRYEQMRRLQWYKCGAAYAEVASMLLDELHFGYMKNEYPLKVVKDVKSWKVYGNSYESPVHIQLYRKTGMVMDY